MASHQIKTRHKGRTSKYAGVTDDARAHGFALLGYVDTEIAEAMGISNSTLYNWKRKHPGFAEAIASGGQKANVRVQQALYFRATGGYVTETKAFRLRDEEGKEYIKTVDIQRFIPPDTQAGMYWLNNRDPEHWKIIRPLNTRHHAETKLATSQFSPARRLSQPCAKLPRH